MIAAAGDGRGRAEAGGGRRGSPSISQTRRLLPLLVIMPKMLTMYTIHKFAIISNHPSQTWHGPSHRAIDQSCAAAAAAAAARCDNAPGNQATIKSSGCWCACALSVLSTLDFICCRWLAALRGGESNARLLEIDWQQHDQRSVVVLHQCCNEECLHYKPSNA